MPTIDKQGIIQFTMKSSSMYIFQYNAAESDTFHLYQIIPLVATPNPCCTTYGMWSVTVKDSTYADYQGQVIKVRK